MRRTQSVIGKQEKVMTKKESDDAASFRSDALLPCPFCGSSSVEVEEADRDCHKYWLRVRCIKCNSTGPVCGRFKGNTADPIQETIKAWNKQANHEDAKAYREMMASFSRPDKMLLDIAPAWDSRNVGQ